ncbi:suppressor of fused domain protein [Kroppenstedtia eburnea]|uniref:Suppressor of fused protein (SUFU) n=1 Tax=Kroppenstedtia eburnea TaxID=714067 RepID=A0A1N7LIP9_9BACL|nr:suppressor of fused domain protein [Kroppenstedtia eburnea]EGK07827.1 hypothetical protein HMPREF9374_3547 [Desmospora sp. 8437]QKI81316.1 suppressor of fused domain protein [Kroppenstedtia eburnea]SIS73738.1 Suppressor of fused protein (SUFU) [Kroppenstedtia eburnea]
MSEHHEEEAVGWDAIDEALKAIYPEQEPKHYAPLIPYLLGGGDPLNGISVYERTEPVPHWHYVTYGFSELFEKESDDPKTSGYGFELTFRLKKETNDCEPPTWANHFLNNIARYVFSTGNVFAAGHHLNLNGPIAAEEETEIRAITFVQDPELEPIDTPNGNVEFLQVVGITLEEETAVQAWNCLKLMELLAPYLPMYVTDLSRSSLLQHHQIAEAVEEGIEKDGSSTGSLFVDFLEWKEQKKAFGKNTYKVRLGAKQAEPIAQVLKGRLSKGKSLLLHHEGGHVEFLPADQDAVEVQDGILQVKLQPDSCTVFIQQLVPQARTFDIPGFPGIQFEIVKSYIKDQQGEVVEVIG